MLTSKDVLERTGISRATLNNYIAGGLVPRPEVLPPGPEDGAAPRIGYFPDDTVERIETIQRLKREGWSIARIVAHLQDPTAASRSAATAGSAASAASAASALAAAPAPTTPSLFTSTTEPVKAAPADVAASGSAPVARPAASPPVRPANRRTPTLSAVAVLVTSLEDAPGLWVQLSAQEYFELVDEIWNELDAIFRGHGGLPARHPDEGMTSCFLGQRDPRYLWNALAAAHAAREAIRRLSLRWRERKAWQQELAMNTGLAAGEDWVGEIGAGDLRVMGEAAHRAEQLSRLGGGGSIIATRDLIGRLSPQERSRVSFGTPLSTFSRLALVALPGPVPASLANLAVAPVLDVRETSPDGVSHP